MPSSAKRLWWLRLVALALWLSVSAVLAWLLAIYPRESMVGAGRDFSFFIGERESLDALAERLAAERVLRHPSAFTWYLRLQGGDHELMRGYVPMKRTLAPRDVLPRLLRMGIRVTVQVTIPEGLNRFDIGTRLERLGITSRGELLRASEDAALLAELGIGGNSAEGYLFPATYELRTASPAASVVRRMVQAFRHNTAALWSHLALLRSAGKSLLSEHQALVLASIVEKEARMADERATIAGTFLNRLLDPTFVPHRLQADPTVAYGCLVAAQKAISCETFDGRRVTPQMVRDPDNPYNTYRIEGLPPGPIASPGLASLRAAIEPEQHDYFYFVASGGGRHTFSHTLEQHNQAVSAPR